MILDLEDQQLGMPGHGWQQAATDLVHSHFVEKQVRPRLGEMEQALLFSQGGPLFGVPLFCCLTSALARFDSALFWVLFLRRLWLPLPPSFRNLPVRPSLGRLWSPPCSNCGGWSVGSSGFFRWESARVCREAGARVGTDILVRDLDSVQGRPNSRQFEVVRDGLPLFHGARWAIDTTLVRLAAAHDLISELIDLNMVGSSCLKWHLRGLFECSVDVSLSQHSFSVVP